MRSVFLILVLSLLLFSTVVLATRTTSALLPSSPITHIVVVLQENHTYDNYFATYVGGSSTNCVPGVPGGVPEMCQYQNSILAPLSMPVDVQSASADYDNGAMDGFYYTEGSIQTMGYYGANQLQFYYAVAANYVLADNYFSSYRGPSSPNHVFLVAGQSSTTSEPIFQELDSAGVSWKVYGPSSLYTSFPYIHSQSSAYVSAHFVNAPVFTKDLSGNSLPQVSYIIGAPGGDEHPSQDLQNGENSVENDIVNPIGNSAYWSSVAIFIAWDDYGGFYDHVVPPSGFGFRVPCLIVSPYARSGVVDSSGPHDHTSILNFVEQNFGLAPLPGQRMGTGNMLEAFNFNQPPRPFSWTIFSQQSTNTGFSSSSSSMTPGFSYTFTLPTRSSSAAGTAFGVNIPPSPSSSTSSSSTQTVSTEASSSSVTVGPSVTMQSSQSMFSGHPTWIPIVIAVAVAVIIAAIFVRRRRT